MNYFIEYIKASDTWRSRELPTTHYEDPSVHCVWDPDEAKRTYSVKIMSNKGMGEALEKGRAYILSYIEEHKDPFVTLTEVARGEAAGRGIDELIHELCRAVLKLENEKNEECENDEL